MALSKHGEASSLYLSKMENSMNVSVKQFENYITNFPIDGVYSTVACITEDIGVNFNEICRFMDDSNQKDVNIIVENLFILEAMRNKKGNFIEVNGKRCFRSFDYFEMELLENWDNLISDLIEKVLIKAVK